MSMSRQLRSNQWNGWSSTEFGDTEFGDKRLTKRLVKLSDSLVNLPESSINQACGRWSETKAAYRFFQNENVSVDEILSAHAKRTVERAQNYATILAIQDTSYISYTGHTKTTGLCKLTSRMGTYSKIEGTGLIMHTTLAVTTDGLPLGMLDQKIDSRKPVPEEIKELKKKSHGNSLPIESKESIRWLESLQESCKPFKEKNTRIVTICDREGDMYDFFERAHHIGAPVLVRASQDRIINKAKRYSKKKSQKLWSVVENFPCQGTISIKIPARNNKPSRIATLEVRFGVFTMNLPRNNFKSRKENINKEGLVTNLTMTAVYVVEKNPPSGEEALEWMLLTNLFVNNFNEAVEKIRWYCLRWKIEVFHKILKSGFLVEECRLGTAERLRRYLTVTSIIACRIFFITLIGRTNPDLPCTFLLFEEEWKILYLKIYKTKEYPDNIPTINEAIQLIAQLGGFLGRKNDGNPGPITLWRGWRRLSDLVEGSYLSSSTYICG